MRNLFYILLFFLVMSLSIGSAVAREVVLAASSWEPYTGVGEDGQGHGIYVDILREVFEKELGMDLKVRIFPWKRAQHFVKSGLADMVVTVATDERLHYAAKSDQQILDLSLHAFTYADHPKLNLINSIVEVKDIKRFGLIPVSNFGNNWHRDNIDNLGVATQYVPSEKHAFQVLAAKRADITLEPLFAGKYLIRQQGMESKIIATKARLKPLAVHLLVSMKSPLIESMDDINGALARVRNSGRIDVIMMSYQ